MMGKSFFPALLCVVLLCLLTACEGRSPVDNAAPSPTAAPPQNSAQSPAPAETDAPAAQMKPSKIIGIRDGGLVVDFQGQGCTILPMPEEVEFATE